MPMAQPELSLAPFLGRRNCRNHGCVMFMKLHRYLRMIYVD